MMKTAGTTSSCPYASALSDDEDGSHSNDATHYRPTSEALALARSKCPAFAGGNPCPFRNATNSESLKEVMEQVPPSHFPLVAKQKNNVEDRDVVTSVAAARSQAEINFQLAMEHVHQVSSELGKETTPKSPKEQQFLIQGGCPFKSFHRDHSSSESSGDNLARAMEEYSVAFQIGRMVADNGEDDFTNDNDEGEEPRRRSSLSDALKNGTAESHEAAENVHFVKNFIHGKIDRELFAEMVAGLYHTYLCLESLLSSLGPKHFPTLHFAKELSRTDALKEDMEFWHGSGWETDPKCGNPSPAVKDYIDRMEEVSRMDPLLLLSHAYTRYLGDLSGGKVLSRIARRALNLNGYDGLQFYNFESIPSAVAFKKKYRTALDDLALKPDQMGRLVAEANVAFALNMRVFEELDVRGKVPGARLRPVREALSYYDRIIDQQKNQNADDQEEVKCPFGFKEGPNPHSKTLPEVKVMKANKAKEPSSRCPWPFVFFHDPYQGMKDWQTWFIIGIVLCWCWAQL